MARLPIGASILSFSKYSGLAGGFQNLSTLACLDPLCQITVAAGNA